MSSLPRTISFNPHLGIIDGIVQEGSSNGLKLSFLGWWKCCTWKWSWWWLHNSDNTKSHWIVHFKWVNCMVCELWEWAAAVLWSIVKKALADKVTFEQRLQGMEEVSLWVPGGIAFQAQGTSNAKAQWWIKDWDARGTARGSHGLERLRGRWKKRKLES